MPQRGAFAGRLRNRWLPRAAAAAPLLLPWLLLCLPAQPCSVLPDRRRITILLEVFLVLIAVSWSARDAEASRRALSITPLRCCLPATAWRQRRRRLANGPESLCPTIRGYRAHRWECAQLLTRLLHRLPALAVPLPQPCPTRKYV